MTEVRTLKRIDAVSAPKPDAQLKELQAFGKDEIIMDMEKTTYISPVGLRAFTSAQKRMSKSEGSMTLRSVQPCVKEIPEATGFGGVPIVE